MLGLSVTISAVSCRSIEPRPVPFGNILDPASLDVQQIANLWWFLFALMVVVFVGVTTTLFYVIYQFRARPGNDQGRPIWGNTRLEVVWTAVPALLLTVVFLISLVVIGAIDAPAYSAHPAAQETGESVRVQAIGHLWWWEFRLPDLGVDSVNELHVPVNRRIELELISENVIHSYWVPQLHPKRDVIPGQVNTLSYFPTSTGVFAGVCAQFCGVQHAWMLFRVFVDTEEDFQAWVRAQGSEASPPDSPLAQRGMEIFLSTTCQSCHVIRGVGGQPGVGPELTHMGSRSIIGAGVLENTPEHMARWLRDPQAVKPGNLMPNSRLTEEEVQALTAYMESLK